MSSYSTLLVPGITGFLDPDVYNYAQSLAPLLSLRFNEVSGTTAINYGTVGTAINGTIGGTTTLGQTGKLGANEAYLYDGLTSFVRVPNHTSINALTQFTYVSLINPSSAGEGNFGSFFAWGNGNSTDKEHEFLFNGAITNINFRLHNTVGTSFFATTTTGPAIGQWSLLFAAYNDSGDRKGHVYKGESGALVEFTYAVQQTLTGTLHSLTQPLFIGNRSSFATTFAGLKDWFMLFNRVLTPAEMLNLTKLAGV